jgi:hypothetical protein
VNPAAKTTEIIYTNLMLVELICCTLAGCSLPQTYDVSGKNQITLQDEGPCVLDLKYPVEKIFDGRARGLCDSARCCNVPKASKSGAKTPFTIRPGIGLNI